MHPEMLSSGPTLALCSCQARTQRLPCAMSTAQADCITPFERGAHGGDDRRSRVQTRPPADYDKGQASASSACASASSFQIVLDSRTLVGILDGAITTWLHPDILALNPDGIHFLSGARLTNSSKQIQVLSGLVSRNFAVLKLMRNLQTTFTGRAVWTAPVYDTEVV